MANNVELLEVRVYTPEGIAWEGKARSISSVNSQGPFDLLPEHAHFVSLIENQPIVVVTDSGEEKTFLYKTAVVRLYNDHVRIYVEHAKTDISVSRDTL